MGLLGNSEKPNLGKSKLRGEIDYLIVGAGIIGLNVAKAIAA